MAYIAAFNNIPKMTIVFRMLFISVVPALLAVLHFAVACCVCQFTRFNLLFTLPIILFDKMPILYVVLFRCVVASLK